MFELFTPGRTGRSFLSTTPNRWDWALLPLVLVVLALAAYGAMQMARPFVLGQPTPISLDPAYLPYYLLRTILRMFSALGAALLFTFAFAVVATRWKSAEKIMVPLLDVLQSVPILGFQAIAIAPFIALFPGNLLGVECAAIFAIFTSQAWNMAFSLYQSMKTIPPELGEAARVFRLSPWQRADDSLGVALVRNGLSKAHRDYLAAGGLGAFIGDGRLDYRPEQIFETYYRVDLAKELGHGLQLSLDAQHIVNPAYNHARGPVNVGSIRLHGQY